MSGPLWAMDSADEIIERLAREFEAEAFGEVTFLTTCNIPEKLAGHLAVAALGRAAIKLQNRIDKANGKDNT